MRHLLPKMLPKWREKKSDYVYAVAFAVLAGVSILRFGNPSPFFYFLF